MDGLSSQQPMKKRSFVHVPYHFDAHNLGQIAHSVQRLDPDISVNTVSAADGPLDLAFNTSSGGEADRGRG